MTKEINTMKRIALIAHDGKKAEMVAFVKDHKVLLDDIAIVTTGTTGMHVERSGLKVERKLSGPLGGDAQIASDVSSGRIDGVIFLRDPLGKHPHDPDISMLLRICDVHNVPLATNLASAELIIKGLSLAD
ncbi:MAG: methylglyoxal synthase [Thermodesulfobacteriota bacterium]|nr:methylglyoxal synthase [Thermodesulfobacteriota bacterium]